MATMVAYPWGTVLYTREEESRQTLIERAVESIFDFMDSTEWDDVPTYESTGLGRNYNKLVDVGIHQRTSPKYNFTSRNRDRK